MDGVIMEYGLIGEKLSHSFSKELHEGFLNTSYELISLPKEDLKDFFLKKDFKGINVTIPYKKEVIQYLDFVDDIVITNLIHSSHSCINSNWVR